MMRFFCLAILMFFYTAKAFAGGADHTSYASGSGHAENLRCEYAVNPANIDVVQPRLSWNIASPRRNWKQGAYRILVASSRTLLNNDKGDLWDSKKVTSDASSQISYAGKALASYQVVYWKVKVWDDRGVSSEWSSAAHWEMGILRDKDWKAHWIGRTDHAYNAFDNCLEGSHWIWAAPKNLQENACFKKSFLLSSVNKLKEAYLLYTAIGHYKIFLNGHFISQDSPAVSYQQLKKINIGKYLNRGRNTLRVDVSNPTRLKGLISRLLVRYQRGDSVMVTTDASWSCATPSGADAPSEVKVLAPYDGPPFRKYILHPPSVDPAPFLRKEFTTQGRIVRARIYASAPGFAELRLNGRKVGGTRERDPGFTRFDSRLLYAAYDVTDMLKPGNNALGAILGTGWYDVHDQAVWSLEKAPWRGRPRIKLQLYIEYADGHTQTIPTDTSWKAHTGPLLFDGIYTGDIYDANKEMPGWDEPGFQDKNWKRAILMADPGGKLVALSCPPVALDSTVKPIAITEPRPGIYVVDMGLNFSGHTQLRIRAPKGTRITMRYGEVLDDSGMLETKNIGQFMALSTPKQPFQTDTYICKGVGLEVWEQRFSYSGFRYVEVTGLPFRPTLDNFRGKFTHTLLETDGRLETSDTLINKINQIVQTSYLSNAQNIPTDCPQREKNGWTGDAHLAAETGIMNYNTASFYSKWLDDQMDAQLSSGLIPVIVPSAGWGIDWEPEWNSAYELIAWYLYEYYGDKRILEKHYAHLKRYVDSLAIQRKDDHLLGAYSYGDWDPLDTHTSKKLTANVYLFADADILSRIAGVLQLPVDSAKYRFMAEDIKTHFNKKFLDTATCIYGNGSQCAMSLPLYYGMVPGKYKDRVEQHTARLAEQVPHIDAGILGTKTILRVLAEIGRTDLAYHMVDRSAFPGWGYWISQGATSLWGGWGKPGVKNTGSLNHIMFGDVSAWLYNNIAGIAPDPAHPGFKHFMLQPGMVGDLKWVKASYHSIQGNIAIDWQKSDSLIEVHATIPANTTATVILPADSEDQIREGGKPLGEITAIGAVRQQDHKVFLEAGSGSYHFTIEKKK